MSLPLFRDKAARQRLAAEASTSQNVRERYGHAGQAWNAAVRRQRGGAMHIVPLAGLSEKLNCGLAAPVYRNT